MYWTERFAYFQFRVVIIIVTDKLSGWHILCLYYFHATYYKYSNATHTQFIRITSLYEVDAYRANGWWSRSQKLKQLKLVFDRSSRNQKHPHLVKLWNFEFVWTFFPFWLIQDNETNLKCCFDTMKSNFNKANPQ